MTDSATRPPRPRATARASMAAAGEPGLAPAMAARRLGVMGSLAAVVVAGTGVVIVTLLVLVGWVAAPHAGEGLTGVLRTAVLLWLIGHHVGFALRGTGHVGLLPLGLVLLPGALLWRAGRWIVRAAGVRRLRHVALAAAAIAVPYCLAAGALAAASGSPMAEPSVWQALACGFLIALGAAGLGGAHALAPWRQLAEMIPGRARSLTVGTAAALTVLAAAGSMLVAVSLGLHLAGFRALNASLDPGLVGSGLLLLAQLGYLPNAITWGIAFTLGPGFAFGTGTVVSPTGSALGSLPALPMLAALPPGLHSGVPPALSVPTLAVPYLAGAVGGLLMIRGVSTLPVEAAPLRGIVCGLACGLTLGVLAAFAGGPLGDGRLAAVGPSPWQVGVSAALEVGVAAAITAGTTNWLRLRGTAASAGSASLTAEDAGDHLIYMDPWAGAGAGDPDEPDELDGMAGPALTDLSDPAALPGSVGAWPSGWPGPGGTRPPELGGPDPGAQASLRPRC
jgi:hypothetical protein